MRKPFILAMLAATALAPATAFAKDKQDARHGRHAAPRAAVHADGRAHVRTPRATPRTIHSSRTARKDRSPRTFTPPRSTAAPALIRKSVTAQTRTHRRDARQEHRREARQEHRRDARQEHRREARQEHRRDARQDRRREARQEHRRDVRRDWRSRYTNRRDQYRTRRNFHHRSDWNRNWRSNHRYDWRDYRARNRAVYRLPRYYAPRGYDYGYRRFSIGLTLGSILFQQQYWINDPGYYRLPPAYGTYRWVRYYNDALLVDIRTGYVEDVIYDIFW